MSLPAPPGWVRVGDITGADLTAEEKFRLLTVALTELGIAEALRLVHRDRWPERYAEIGALVRFDADGDPWVRRDAEPRT